MKKDYICVFDCETIPDVAALVRVLDEDAIADCFEPFDKKSFVKLLDAQLSQKIGGEKQSASLNFAVNSAEQNSKIVNSEQNKNTVILNNICNIENLEENKNLKLYILIDEEVKEKNQKLKEIILKNKGDNQVFLAFKTNEKKEVVKLSEKYNVNLSLKFIRKVAKLVGADRIKLK